MPSLKLLTLHLRVWTSSCTVDAMIHLLTYDHSSMHSLPLCSLDEYHVQCVWNRAGRWSFSTFWIALKSDLEKEAQHKNRLKSRNVLQMRRENLNNFGQIPTNGPKNSISLNAVPHQCRTKNVPHTRRNCLNSSTGREETLPKTIIKALGDTDKPLPTATNWHARSVIAETLLDDIVREKFERTFQVHLAPMLITSFKIRTGKHPPITQ